jgi:transcriptional regulator with XRE-family HTH domain
MNWQKIESANTNAQDKQLAEADPAHSIDLNLRQKLQDKEYRRKFFWTESSARIAAELIALRKRRGLNQTQVAKLIGTKQPAISRAEQADYQNWNLGTLRAIADAMDARIRVIIEPSEDILREYDGDADVEREALGILSGPAIQAVQARPIGTAPSTQPGVTWWAWWAQNRFPASDNRYPIQHIGGAIQTSSVIATTSGANLPLQGQGIAMPGAITSSFVVGGPETPPDSNSATLGQDSSIYTMMRGVAGYSQNQTVGLPIAVGIGQ